MGDDDVQNFCGRFWVVEAPGDQIAILDVLIAKVENVVGCDWKARHKAECFEGYLGGPEITLLKLQDQIDVNCTADSAVKSHRITANNGVLDLLGVEGSNKLIEEHEYSIYQYILIIQQETTPV